MRFLKPTLVAGCHAVVTTLLIFLQEQEEVHVQAFLAPAGATTRCSRSVEDCSLTKLFVDRPGQPRRKKPRKPKQSSGRGRKYDADAGNTEPKADPDNSRQKRRSELKKERLKFEEILAARASNPKSSIRENSQLALYDSPLPLISSSSGGRNATSSSSLDLDLPEKPSVKTIAGGTPKLFDMVRRMAVWSDSIEQQQQREQQEEQQEQHQLQQKQQQKQQQQLPRWRPLPSTARGDVSDDNPSFRTQPPAMNAAGYAAVIWRNVRKQSKPVQWRYALRTFERMQEQTTTSTTSRTAVQMIERENNHYEGALLACAKLGLWKKALQIFREVQQRESEGLRKLKSRPSAQPLLYTTGPPPATTYNKVNNNNLKNNQQHMSARTSLPVHVTDNMVTSFVKACVRESRKKKSKKSVADSNISNVQNSMESSSTNLDSNETEALALFREERAVPLNAALSVLKEMEKDYGMPCLDARHLNPVAAAFQSLGRPVQAASILQNNLADRSPRIESEDGSDPFNVNDLGAKDKGSYTLLVKGAVSDGDWAQAVDALRNMTEAGLYPNARHLNAWNEVAEKKKKHWDTRSWKKKRDEYWLKNIR